MADFAGMVAQERLRSGTTFAVEILSGAAPSNYDADTGWKNLDKTATDTRTTASTTHLGMISPALDSPEIVAAAQGTIEADDQLLLYDPALDLGETATRQVTIVWQSRRYRALDLDLFVMADQNLSRRAILRLREGAGVAGA